MSLNSYINLSQLLSHLVSLSFVVCDLFVYFIESLVESVSSVQILSNEFVSK
jgi:hypothetical protein